MGACMGKQGQGKTTTPGILFPTLCEECVGSLTSLANLRKILTLHKECEYRSYFLCNNWINNWSMHKQENPASFARKERCLTSSIFQVLFFGCGISAISKIRQSFLQYLHLPFIQVILHEWKGMFRVEGVRFWGYNLVAALKNKTIGKICSFSSRKR